MNNKIYLRICLEALACFLIVCWSLGLSYLDGLWMETISFYLFAMYETRRYKKYLPVKYIAISIIIGRIILEIPIRLYDFYGSIGSMPIMFVCVISICLGCICAKSNFRFIYLFLTWLILCLLNILIYHVARNMISCWIDKMNL